MSTRINKYISELGIASRRQADTMVADGRLSINDRAAIPGSQVRPGDVVKLDGRVISGDMPERVYIAFNKPEGITCTMDLRDPTNIIDFIDYPERIFPVGRLDKASTGLILLTNDGDLVNLILRARYGHEKEYEVTVRERITPEFMAGMRKPVPILNTLTKPSKIRQLDTHRFRITLSQGMNRQIRRMCEYFDYHVISLERRRIMNVTLGNLNKGQWRYLSEAELQQMTGLIEDAVRAAGETWPPTADGSLADEEHDGWGD